LATATGLKSSGGRAASGRRSGIQPGKEGDFSASGMTQILLNGCKYLNFAACRHISARLAGFKAKGA
jgi:hypothetical protein